MKDTEVSWGFASSSTKETTWWSRLALLRVWKWAAVLHMFSLQSRQQRFAGCFSPQASQSCEPVLFPTFSLGVSFTRSNNANSLTVLPLQQEQHLDFCMWDNQWCYHGEVSPDSLSRSCVHNSEAKDICFGHCNVQSRLNTLVSLMSDCLQ